LDAALQDEQSWSQQPLEEGQPLEYEDKWGKRNAASYSVLVDNLQVSKSLPVA